MPMHEFWTSVRVAAKFMAPPRVTVDSRRLDPDAIARRLSGATLWLTPAAVAGFDEADLSFLPPETLARLTGLVSGFAQIASEVPRRAPASAEQIAAARLLFAEIVALMEFHRYADADAFRIGHQVERSLEGRRPPEIADLRFRTGPDSTGDPGVWIWAILAEDDDEKFLDLAQDIRPVLEQAARAAASDRWPYVSFRSEKEQNELSEELSHELAR